MLPHGLEHIGHLLTLPLGPGVLADPLLQKLETSLVLGNPQQLHCSTLVGRESGDFSDQVPDHLVPVGQLPFRVGRLLLQGIDRGLVAFVHAHTDLIPGSHGLRRIVFSHTIIFTTMLRVYCLFSELAWVS